MQLTVREPPQFLALAEPVGRRAASGMWMRAVSSPHAIWIGSAMERSASRLEKLDRLRLLQGNT